MELMTYKTRALRTLSLLILVALIAALNPPSLTDSTAFAQATAPELTSSANTANQVDLSWTEVTGADDYELWRWEDAEGWVELDDSISGTSYADTGVTAGLTYYYQVSADGGTTWSNRVNETVGAYDASTLANPTATSTAISLSWSEVTGAASYELWRYETSWTQVGGTLTATTYADASVEIGKTYFYQVMAKGPNGDGAWSNRESATVPSTTPGAPQSFSASPSDAQVMLSWNEPVSNGGSAITGYQYRYQMAGGSWSIWMAPTPALGRTATVSSLTNESAHNFEVQAVNANGAGPAATASATPMAVAPSIPTGLGSTSTGPTEIQLTWNSADGAASYQLQRRTNGGDWGSPIDVSGTTYTDSDVTPSTTYDYEVRAVNASFTSEWSGVATVSTTAPTAPDAPALDAMASADKITLTWSAPASNGADITGYDLDVSDDGSDWSDLSTPAAGDTSAEHTNLGPGTMKYYRLRAMNSVGYSEWSTSAMDTVAAVVPGKPTLFTAVSGTTVTLTWVAPAANGGAAVTAYTIQVSTTGTGGWGSLATKAGDDASHDHTGLRAGDTRYYQIRASNSVGAGEWSDVASATIAGAAPLDRETPDATSPRNFRSEAEQLADAATAGTSTTSILLEWDAPTLLQTDTRTASSYEIEQWNDATQAWESVTDDDDTNLTTTVSELKGVTKFYYRVRTVFDDASKGMWAEQTSATTVAVSPSMPTLTATKMGTDKIVLTWSVPDDGGSDIIGYILEVSGTSGSFSEYLDAAGAAGSTAVLLDAAQQSVTHTMTSGPAALTAGSTWYYRISAVNGVAVTDDPPVSNAAWSAMSAEATATTDQGVPGAPTLELTGGTGQITIAITANANTGGSAITSHEVQVYDVANDSWTILQDDLESIDPYGGLDANVTVYFRARSKNVRGAGPWTTDSATTADGGPSAPKLTATVNGPNSITLSWTVPANNGGNDITDYVVQMSDSDTEAGSFATVTTAGSGLTDDDVTASTLMATHMGLSAGDTRHYRVQATNGTAGAWSNVMSATTATGGVPAAPAWDGSTPLAATGTTITLNWDDVTDATGYDIAMWEDGEWVIIAEEIASTPTEYVESDLSSATTYYFSVRARNASGAGPWSGVESIETDAGAPGKPDLTAAPDGATKIVLTWAAPDSGGGTITDYLVQVSNNGTTSWAAFDSTATDNVSIGTDNATRVATATGAPAPPLTVTHTGLNGRQKRFYRVLASTGDPTSADNRGTWSDVKYATTPAGVPGQPVLIATLATGTPALSDEIRLTWTVEANGGSAITQYQVQVWGRGMWMELATPSTMSHNHKDLPGMTTRYYRVRAMNSVGYGDWSTSTMGTTAAGKPGAPVLHADQNGSSEIRLTWTEPENGGTTITFYQIQVSNDGQSGWTSPATSTIIIGGERVTQIAVGTQNYNHTGLDPATTRYYRVRAVNGDAVSDAGPWSNTAMASTLGGRPGRPTLTALPSGTSMINLAWTPPTGDGGSAITGYEIEYWDGSNGWMNLVNPAAGATSYTHRNIGGGTTKFYRIRAMNSGGTGSWSTTAYATTATTVPAPPVLMAMADGATKIKLTWTAGHDGGLPITDYYLQHSSDRGTTWADLGDAMSNMMMMSTEDTGLSGGTTKHYRIRATNSKGSSGWSPLASDTTDRSVPGRPTLLVRPLPKAIYLTWATPATPTGGSAITRYEVEKWDSASRRWVSERTTTSTTHTDSGLTTGKKYFYRVRAVNAMGDGPWSTFAGETAQ